MRRYLSAAVIVGIVASLAPAASGSYHENLITEVHQGVGDTGDYVELQAYAAGQNLVGGHYIVNYDGGNGTFSTFQFPSNVANGANQATILVAHDASTIGADFTSINLRVVNTNGATCFLDTTVPLSGLDCVDWGIPMGGTLPSQAGSPVLNNATGLADNTSISRNITRGCATALDLADDTNNSVADFALAAASPRANTVAPTETPCAAAKKKCKKKKTKKKSGAYEAKKKKCKKKKKKK
jgi:hypothetical protein